MPVTITLTQDQVDSVIAQAGGIPVPPLPPDPPIPPDPTDPLSTFNYLFLNANECVAWRYVLQEPAPYPTKAALIEKMGQTAYNQKVNWCSYNCPQAFFTGDKAWWVNPEWTGPYPQSVGEPPEAWLSVPMP